MKTKFTKGEWEYAESANELDFLIFSGDSPTKLIAITDESTVADKYRNKEKAEANAKLIAAAPELLKALTDLVDKLDNDYSSWFWMDKVEKAKKAIKKATE